MGGNQVALMVALLNKSHQRLLPSNLAFANATERSWALLFTANLTSNRVLRSENGRGAAAALEGYSGVDLLRCGFIFGVHAPAAGRQEAGAPRPARRAQVLRRGAPREKSSVRTNGI